MIGDTVAIEIPDAVSELDRGRAIGACEAALGDDSCSLRSEGLDSDWTARVNQSSAEELTIELIVTGTTEVDTVRVLTFSEDELEAFRWQSVGVVVAALVLSRNRVAPEPTTTQGESDSIEPSEEPAAEPREEPPARVDAPEATPRLEARRRQEKVTLDLAGLMATSGTGSAAGGAWLGTGLRLAGPLHLLVQGDAIFSRTDESEAELRSTVLGGSLGLGLRGGFGRSDLGWEMSARAAMQSLRVRASTESETGVASTVRIGARGGLAAVWRPSGFWGVLVGADAGVLWPPVDLELGAAEPARVSAVFVGGYLGLRMRLNRM